MPPKARPSSSSSKTAAPIVDSSFVDQLTLDKEAAQKRLHEELEVNRRLRQLSSAKDEALKDLEGEAVRLQTVHEREIGLLYDESATRYSAAVHRIRCLELEVLQLKDELRSYVVLDEQNQRLKSESLVLFNKMSQDAERHKAEVEKVALDFERQKQLMEAKYKGIVNDIARQFQERRLQDLGADQKRIMEANAALADRFNEHAQHFGQLIEKYVRLERNSKTASHEKSLVDQQARLVTSQVAALKRQLREAHERSSMLEQEVRDLKTENKSLKEVVASASNDSAAFASLRTELSATKSQLCRERSNASRLRRRLSAPPSSVRPSTAASDITGGDLLILEDNGGDESDDDMRRIWSADFSRQNSDPTAPLRLLTATPPPLDGSASLVVSADSLAAARRMVQSARAPTPPLSLASLSRGPTPSLPRRPQSVAGFAVPPRAKVATFVKKSGPPLGSDKGPWPKRR